jgi:hypothetical protein
VIVTNKVFTGKQVQITFQNNTAVGQVLTGLDMTWPQATNGNLTKIAMGATTIYNTSTASPLHTTTLLGTDAQRTIAANGASATVTFTFQHSVDTFNTDYIGSATFNPFGPVVYLP